MWLCLVSDEQNSIVRFYIIFIYMSFFLSTLQQYIQLLEPHFLSFQDTLPSFGDDPYRRLIIDALTQNGKKLRPALALISAQAYGYVSDIHIFTALEAFHKFILMHDDIIDDDLMRRWKPTLRNAAQELYRGTGSRKHFGTSLAIIGGDLGHNIAMDIILQSSLCATTKVVALQELSRAMESVSRWRYQQFLTDDQTIDEVDIQTIIQYNMIQVTGKYSFTFPLRFGKAVATGDGHIGAEIEELCDCLWVLFQTGDDRIWLFGDPSTTGKSNYGDIIQGKKTIPLYYGYLYATDAEKLLLKQLIGKKDLNEEEAHTVRSLLSQRGGWATQAFIDSYVVKCHDLLKKVSLPIDLHVFLEGFVEYLVTRDK